MSNSTEKKYPCSSSTLKDVKQNEWSQSSKTGVASSRFGTKKKHPVQRNLELEGSLKKVAINTEENMYVKSDKSIRNGIEDSSGNVKQQYSRKQHNLTHPGKIDRNFELCSPNTTTCSNSTTKNKSCDNDHTKVSTRFSSHRIKENTLKKNSIYPISRSNCDAQYTVHFESGPIGIKLDSVVKHSGREIGCRIMKFVENYRVAPSNHSKSDTINTKMVCQAKKSGQIEIGDVLVAIDGKNIMSKNYSEIVTMLKIPASDHGRDITFRSVRNQQLNISPLSCSISTLTKQVEAINDKPSPIVLENLQPLSSVKARRTTSNKVLFSPSHIKEITRSPSFNRKASIVAEYQSKPITMIFTSILNNILPTVMLNEIQQSENENDKNDDNSVTEKLGETIIGSTSRVFDDAVKMKMELLTELSQAKITIGELAKSNKKLKSTCDLQEIDLNDQKLPKVSYLFN